MSLTIHGIAASRAIRPLWAATELGLKFSHQPTPYQGGVTRSPDFLALNPNGHIPVVVDARPEGEVVVWESMACALYIARHHGVADGQSLTPATPKEDADALRWSFWAVTECETDALTVLMHRMAMPTERRKPELAEAATIVLPKPMLLMGAARLRLCGLAWTASLPPPPPQALSRPHATTRVPIERRKLFISVRH